MWFDKQNKDTLYIDIRSIKPHVVGKGKHARVRKINPDIVMDFRDMKLPDNTFSLVVFDPPHLNSLGNGSFTEEVYGKLDKNTWKEDLKKGFSECFRVLKKDGVLIFKWSEVDISLKDILALTKYKPLFGHRSGKAQKTHWVTFIKSND